MSKNSKRTKKNKDKVPSDGGKQCSDPVNNHMSNGKAQKFPEETSDTSKKKENITTPSEMLHTNADEYKMEHTNTNETKMGPEPPQSNPEEVSQLKNTIRSIKSNLNTVSKKYENEKKEKEKYYNENQYLKSRLSSLEMELCAAKMEIEKLEKGKAHPRKSFEAHDQMEVDTTVDDSCKPPEQKASDEATWEEKEHNLAQSNTQGTIEKASSIGKQDSEMTNAFDGEETGLAQGYDQRKDGNWQGSAWDSDTEAENNSQHLGSHTALTAPGLVQGYDQDKDGNWRAAGWGANTEAGSNSQNVNYRTALTASDSGTRGENRRGGDARQWRQQNPRGEMPPHQPPNRNEEQHHGPRFFHNDRGNRPDDNFRGRGRGRDNRGDREQNNNRNIRDKPSVVTEVSGDLFEAPDDCSLAHCVAEDMRMGSGIAVTFRQKFKRVDELLDQRVRQGHVAVLEHEGRYIYYLVTKRESNGKPTMDTLEDSLMAMRQHVVEKNVKKIAMPRIGCGLDRLEWRRVRPLIERTFSTTCAQITVYNYNEDLAEPSKSKPASNVWLKNDSKPVADIAPMTAILCLCAADGSVDSTFGRLDRRFQIMTPFQQMDRKLGNILDIERRDYCIFLLIVKETKTSPLSFMALGECVREACKLIDKQQYYYVAVEAFDDKDDDLLFEKVITVIKTYLDTKWPKELWVCWPKTVSGKYNTRPNSGT